MHLRPGGTGSVQFHVQLEGQLSATGTAVFTVYRNGVATTVPVTVSSPVPGQYITTFTVPSNWVEYDLVEMRAELTYGLGTPRTIACTKSVGVVTEAPLDIDFIRALMVADQVKTGNTITYYEQGSGQTVILHQQEQTGDPCDGDVSLTSP